MEDCRGARRIVRSQALSVPLKLSGALTYLLRGLGAITQMRPRTLGQDSTASCGDSTSLPATVIMKKHVKKLMSEANPSHLSSQCNFVSVDGTSQEMQKTADACCHSRHCCRFHTKKKVIDVQPSTVLNEKELVADAFQHCSHAAPPCSAESRPKVAHCVMVELASVLE